MSEQTSARPIRYLVFSASMRADSFNTRLAHLAADVLKERGAVVDYASFAEFDAPSFNGDDEVAGLYPAGPIELDRRLKNSDAFVISSPEYNASMPGSLKNVIDWVSRCKPQPFNELHGLLLSASPSMVGGNRGLWALRVPFEHLGARVFPDMFSLAQAHKSFDESGRLLDAELQRRFDSNVEGFMSLVEASTNYPCAKKAWVEYLGQQADPVLDRVE
jgi:chromate reductase, NAD(P)H dehydrogenase (quinone)